MRCGTRAEHCGWWFQCRAGKILAFDEIRLYGAKSVQVMRRMKALASDLIAALPRSDTPRSNIIKSAWTDYCQVVWVCRAENRRRANLSSCRRTERDNFRS